MVARSRVAGGISSFSSYAVAKSSPQRQSGPVRQPDLKSRVRNLSQSISSNRTENSGSSYLGDIDYGSSKVPLHSEHVQNIQGTIDSLTNLRRTQSGGRKEAVSQQIIALQKEMVQASAREQGWDAPVSSGTLRARNTFLNALQAVVDESERYNRTGVYREGLSTHLLENLQDSMNADFFKLVGTNSGLDLLDQVDSIGVNLTRENIDFINQHTGLVDILYANYDDALAEGDAAKPPRR